MAKLFHSDAKATKEPSPILFWVFFKHPAVAQIGVVAHQVNVHIQTPNLGHNSFLVAQNGLIDPVFKRQSQQICQAEVL